LQSYGDLVDYVMEETEDGLRALLAGLPALPPYTPPGVQAHVLAPGTADDDIGGDELAAAELPPLSYLVEGILPAEGLTLLTAAPKKGKSWLALLLALRVAAGEALWGRQVTQGRVLYFALEDGYRRIQARQAMLCGNREAPAALRFDVRRNTLNGGLLDSIKRRKEAHPALRLVIIDTLQMVRDSTGGGRSAYASDYEDLARVKAFADSLGICILLIHHNRKMQSENDVFEMVSGTNAITGAADTILLIARERESSAATLHVTGRDCEETSLTLELDKKSCEWRMSAVSAELYAQRKEREYTDDPVVQAIRALVAGGKGRWEGTASALIAAGALAQTPTALSHRINALEAALLKYDKIRHERARSGHNGERRHVFAKLADAADADICLPQ